MMWKWMIAVILINTSCTKRIIDLSDESRQGSIDRRDDQPYEWGTTPNPREQQILLPNGNIQLPDGRQMLPDGSMINPMDPSYPQSGGSIGGSGLGGSQGSIGQGDSQFIKQCMDQGQEQALCEAEKVIYELTNQVRVKNGRQPVYYSHIVAAASRDWSRRQSEGACRWRTICHDGFPLGRIMGFGRENSVRQLTAENVAMFSDRSISGAQVGAQFNKQWVNSSGHLANMISSRPKGMGVGVVRDARGRYFGTQMFNVGDIP